jgi:hypothetical protein
MAKKSIAELEKEGKIGSASAGLLQGYTAGVNKNIKQLPNWIEKNPYYKEYNSAQNDEYLHLINNVIAGSTNEENENKYNQIIHNISKEIVIDK